MPLHLIAIFLSVVPAVGFAVAAVPGKRVAQVESEADRAVVEQAPLPHELFFQPARGGASQAIVSVVQSSACASYSWKGRGVAPRGYEKGVALSFARSLCRLRLASGPSTLALLLSQADSNNDRKDAITHYRTILKAANIQASISGDDTLRALYTIGLGLGMRESSGNFCEGWDASAGSHRPSSAAEAGAFQTSYDSMGASPELQKLYAEYQAQPQRCLLDVFKEGANCRGQSILGSGAGAVYQAFTKACPAFATEYAMVVLRVLRGAFWPINRLEAQVRPECNSMLKNIQDMVDSAPVAVCGEIF